MDRRGRIAEVGEEAAPVEQTILHSQMDKNQEGYLERK